MVTAKAATAETSRADHVGQRPNQRPDGKLRTPGHGVGNQALLRRLNVASPGDPASCSPARSVQRKPILSVPSDRLEREADATADLVMRPAGTVAAAPATINPPAVARRKQDAEPGIADLDTEAAIRAAGRGGEPLPTNLRANFEARFGYDFRQVRVHTDAEAAGAARGVRAKAYATGRDIVFGAGQYAPGTTAGQRLIAHELTHVVQQGAAPGPPGLVHHTAPGPVIARDADDDEIDAIEADKLEIGALLDRCAALDAGQRDRMIGKIGGHAKTTHEERQLACLLVAKFQGSMTRADFYNTYHELLERLQPDQSAAVLDRVGKTVIGKTMYQGTLIDKQSINNVGMKGAPGSSIVVNQRTYVVVDGGVQFKTNDEGGPAKRNNNPGNITVDDNAPLAWSAEIGAYRGRNTDGRFAVFPTYERGRAGAVAWARKHPGLSLLKYFEQYAPSSEPGNNPQSYADTVAAAVTNATEGSANSGTTIQDIMTFKPMKGAGGKDPMEAFVDGQEVAEGYHKGVVRLVAKNDPVLPQEVRDFVAGFDKATGDTNAIADQVAAAAAKENSTPAP